MGSKGLLTSSALLQSSQAASHVRAALESNRRRTALSYLGLALDIAGVALALMMRVQVDLTPGITMACGEGLEGSQFGGCGNQLLVASTQSTGLCLRVSKLERMSACCHHSQNHLEKHAKPQLCHHDPHAVVERRAWGLQGNTNYLQH